METTDLAEIMSEIARIAPLKRHHLAPGMVSGRVNLSPVAAARVLENLRGCEDLTMAVADLKLAAANPIRAQISSGPSVSFGDIPVGFYATRSRTGSNDVDFWRVNRPEEGHKWAGHTFADRVLGGGDGDNPRIVRVGKGEQVAALKAIIANGVEESRMLYAETMKRCTVCNRDLSDEESRKWGKGRICREKNGV